MELRKPTKPKEDLMVWLADRLSNGRVASLEVLAEVAAHGHSRMTLFRAKAALRIVSEREGWGPGSAWYWRLPSTDNEV